MVLHTNSVIKRNSPPKLGGVPASLASRRGGSKAGLLQEFVIGTTPPRLFLMLRAIALALRGSAPLLT
jgi:hypothetical protein